MKIIVALFCGVVVVVQAASLRDIARDVRSDRVLLDARLATSPHLQQVAQSQGTDLSRLDIPAGGALDLFYRFGFYSLSVRVVPRDDPGAWLVREPTAKVFEENSLVQLEKKGANTFNNQPFQIFLCEDLNELYEAYFRDFTAESIDQPHKIFTGSWRVPIAAKYLGISPEVLVSDSSFVLVKLVKEKTSRVVSGDLRLKPEASEALRAVQPGNTEAVLEFVQRYGSHYVREISIGESIYQVFAISPEQFQQVKRVLGHGVNTIGLNDWSGLYEQYLAPWLVRETGEIKATSGDNGVQQFIDKELRVEGQFSTYPNLIESLIRKPGLLDQLEALTAATVSVIGLNLSSLRSFVVDPQTGAFFDEILNTHSSLFEVNVR